jgi:hypothetical protein
VSGEATSGVRFEHFARGQRKSGHTFIARSNGTRIIPEPRLKPNEYELSPEIHNAAAQMA